MGLQIRQELSSLGPILAIDAQARQLLVTPHHDPALVRQFSMHPADCTLWEARVALPVPVLVTIPGCGHDPVPYTPAQFAW